MCASFLNCICFCSLQNMHECWPACQQPVGVGCRPADPANVCVWYAAPAAATCLFPPFFPSVSNSLAQHSTDIFNNLNLTFWEYMLPGTDAYRYVAWCVPLPLPVAPASAPDEAAGSPAGFVVFQSRTIPLYACLSPASARLAS